MRVFSNRVIPRGLQPGHQRSIHFRVPTDPQNPGLPRRGMRYIPETNG